MTIKPNICPFCGSSEIEVQTDGYLHEIECSGCGVTGSVYDSHDNAVEAWNRRATQPAADQLPAEISLHLMGTIVDEVFDGGIEDASVISDIYRVIARESRTAQPPSEQLWAVHAQGPDDLYAAFSREEAEAHAAELNALPCWAGISVSAVVIESPWPAAEHWKYLVEQEREHHNAAVRGAEHE